MTAAIALAKLDDAVVAAARLRGKSDPEALHDFRVAIRRLRVTIRSYAELRDHVSKKQRRRLRKLARATNRARDAEVQIAWFNDHASRLTAEQRVAVSRVRARLRAHRRTELARIRARLDDSFPQLEHKLRRRLVALRDEPPLGRRTPFSALVIAGRSAWTGTILFYPVNYSNENALTPVVKVQAKADELRAKNGNLDELKAYNETVLTQNGKIDVSLRLLTPAPSSWLDRALSVPVPSVTLSLEMPDIPERRLAGELVRLRSAAVKL